MAHGLKVANKPKLHQALHGYADGHHQLALSTPLKPRDQRRILALSDISGPSARIGAEGYLTGYPLSESGFFALGRTWSAPEMERPGCVWTHTLLIDFSDLAALETLTGLLDLFRRPSGASAAPEYAKPATLALSAKADVSSLAESWARLVIAALYGMPRRRIVAGHFGEEVDLTVLSLWSQQWPRLRRSFRFCTFATADRSADSDSFDLQVVPISDRSARTRFLNVVEAETGAPGRARWLDDAVQDLLDPDGSGLRGCFRRLGADIVAGREAFRPLCRLHRAMTGSHGRPSALGDAITVLQDELGAEQARVAWETVAKAAFERVETLDEPSFRFMWNNLSLVDADTLICGAAQLGKLAWQRDPGLLVPALDDEGPLKVVIERTLAALDASELVAGLARAPAVRGTALTHRPQIIGLPAFWLRLDNVGEAFRAAKDGHLEDAALAAAMLGGRHDLAPQAVQEFGSRLVLQVLCASWDSVGDGIRNWLKESVGDFAVVAEFLATEKAIPLPMLYELSRELPPDAVPNDYGDDPWLVCWRQAVGTIDDSAASYIAAYLLSRALGQRSLCPGELAQLSFERTHAAAANNRLTQESWRLLESRLPWSSSWLEWDRCHRLRVGVTDLFIECGLAPGLFAMLCEDDQLFSLLSERAAKRRRGRNYLKRVRRYIEDEPDSRSAIRWSIIKELLK